MSNETPTLVTIDMRTWLELKVATDVDAFANLPGVVYRSKEELLLRHGRYFTPQPLPRGYRRHRAKAGFCFGNAGQLAFKRNLRYVEGLAVSAELARPVHHAWCIDADTHVIDVTWPTPGLIYLGVVFAHSRVAVSWSQFNQSVLDDWANGWPVLREPYHEVKEWDLLNPVFNTVE